MPVLHAPPPAPAAELAPMPTPVRSSRIRELLRLVDRPGIRSLAGGLPALGSPDAERVRAVLDGVLAETGPLGPVALQYGATEGVDRLRELLARQAGVAPEQVLVTTGSQQGLDLLARTRCRPGDPVVLETPSYLGALQAFEAAGASLLTIAGDADGMVVDQLAALLADGLRPRLVYVVPNFHNPTGTVLPADRRRTLGALADRFGFLVVEDDPYGELRFAGPAVPAIASHAERVVRLGSASKVLAPGLRVGWLIGPRDVVDAAAACKQVADLHTPTLNQLIVAALLEDAPGTEARLRERRREGQQRAEALHDALDTRLGDRVQAVRPTGGMFSWVHTVDGTDTDELFPRALDRGVAFVPGSAFEATPCRPCHTMRLSFATLAPAELALAVDQLADAWELGTSRRRFE